MNNTHLSKLLAVMLRHAPWEFELELDDEGWAPLDQVLDALHRERAFASATRADIERVIAESSKARYQLDGDRLRALYGHSIPGKLHKEASEPPETLYHGTLASTLPLIERNGLQPMSRQYVHLSVDTETANLVARRKGRDVVILTIPALEAHRAGVRFYKGNEQTWLAEEIDPKWIET